MSPGEAAFDLHCRAEKLMPVREFRFLKDRRWRLDFAFPDHMLAIEIEGGIWQQGRHNRAAGMEKDLEKYNTAAKLGWRVLRYSTAMVIRGDAINDTLEMLK